MSKKFFAITLILVGFFALPVLAVVDGSASSMSGRKLVPIISISKPVIIFSDSGGPIVRYNNKIISGSDYITNSATKTNNINSNLKDDNLEPNNPDCNLEVSFKITSTPRDVAQGVYQGEEVGIEIIRKRNGEIVTSKTKGDLYISSEIVYLVDSQGVSYSVYQKPSANLLEPDPKKIKLNIDNYDILKDSPQQDLVPMKLELTVKYRVGDTECTYGEDKLSLRKTAKEKLLLKRIGCPILSNGDVKIEDKKIKLENIKILETGPMKWISGRPIETNISLGISLLDPYNNDRNIETAAKKYFDIKNIKDNIFSLASDKELASYTRYKYQIEGGTIYKDVTIREKDRDGNIRDVLYPQYFFSCKYPAIEFKTPEYKEEDKTPIITGNPLITDVLIIPSEGRSLIEGFYPGETVNISWKTKDIPSDAKMDVYLNLSTNASDKVLVAEDIDNSGHGQFIIPSTVLITTQPDYRPYKVSIVFTYKKNGVVKEAIGTTAYHVYVRKIGCPLFILKDVRYDGRKIVQDFEVENPGEAVTGKMKMRIDDISLEKTESTKEFGDYDFNLDLRKMSEFSKTSKFEFEPNRKYKISFFFRMNDKDGNDFDCYLRREILSPKNIDGFFVDQERKINVIIPELTQKNQFNYGDTITVKWETLPLKTNDKLLIKYIPQTPPNGFSITYKAYEVPVTTNVGFVRIKLCRNSLPGDQNFCFNEDSPYRIAITYQKNGDKNKSVVGYSEAFSVVEKNTPSNKIPLISVKKIEMGQLGITFDAVVSDWAGRDKMTCDFDASVQKPDAVFDEERPRRNQESIGADKRGYVTKAITVNKDNPTLSFKYPTQEMKERYSADNPIFYLVGDRTGQRSYRLSLACNIGDNGEKVLVWRKYGVDAPLSKVSFSGVDIKNIGYYLAESQIQIKGQIISSGYSTMGITPYVELSDSKDCLMDGLCELPSYSATGNAPSKMQMGRYFSIVINKGYDNNVKEVAIDTSKKIFYRICATDNGDGFIYPAKKYCTSPFETKPLQKNR